MDNCERCGGVVIKPWIVLTPDTHEIRTVCADCNDEFVNTDEPTYKRSFRLWWYSGLAEAVG